MLWEPGETPKKYAIGSQAAIELLNTAVSEAKAVGLGWIEDKLVLKPTPELVDLVRRSQEVAAAEDETEAS
jgi:CRISPR-associated protein Csb1